MLLNPIVYMQVEISNLYRARLGISLDDFLLLDKKYDILAFIEEGYEQFHLMGNEGILEELQQYVNDCEGINIKFD